ncbi:TetR/AcrR family transcriptional regulator [Streptantibioticus silvisoli]|uniref:TetR/AcrR family transcriptional regulator n=1 Tax=Streptantibioticus silvisoli TaxID=2705255 RepID=A0ABT6VZ46_9ACTN|nr:TetR/AcrR family transcriptional regulator [Streptantibioticus silvisoli]MDI5963762.1 TetR/AcrR family transcriptional regulator [Streptantibioticus silvisoli]
MRADAKEPRSRRERPAKPALTRAGIVAAAVEVMRSEGLERVTMRRLAQELDTGPASLYVYVANTAELHAAILDELLGAVDLSAGRAGGDWRDRLLGVLTSYIEVLFEHPALARSALVARPSGDHYLDLVEAVLALLAEGGVAPARAAWGVDLLLLFATSTAAEQSTRDQDAGAQDDWDALTGVLRAASADRHPHIAALGDTLLSGTGPARLTWGFQALISGLLATPVPDTTGPPGRRS